MDECAHSFTISPTGHCIANLLIEAFLTLSRSRQCGMGVNPIMIQEIKAYHRATDWSAIDFEEFMIAIQDMDAVFMKWSDEKAKEEADRANKKTGKK